MRTRIPRHTCHVVAGALLTTLPASADDPRIQGLDGFQVEEIHQADTQVLLLVAGDVDGSHPGPELLAVDRDGTLLMLVPGEPEWTVTVVPVPLEPMISMHTRPAINVGDVHPGFPGNEIVVETENTVHVLVQTGPGQWASQVVLDGEKFFGICWGVRIGDIDPARPGQELFFITETAGDVSAGWYAAETDGAWPFDYVFGAEVGMDSAIGDSNPAVPGHEIVFTTEMGPTYEITPTPGEAPWPARTLWDDFDNAGWTLRIADVLPEVPGNEIVYGSRYNDRVLLSRETGAGHTLEVLFTGEATEPASMWDIGVGDVVPASPTLEIVAVDDPGFAYLVQHDGNGWVGDVLWSDPVGSLHAVVVAEDLLEAPGTEIVLAGASGRIVLITADDEPGVPGDATGDGVVDVDDLVAVIVAWGPCPAPPAACPADVDGSGEVGVDDLIMVITSWT